LRLMRCFRNLTVCYSITGDMTGGWSVPVFGSTTRGKSGSRPVLRSSGLLRFHRSIGGFGASASPSLSCYLPMASPATGSIEEPHFGHVNRSFSRRDQSGKGWVTEEVLPMQRHFFRQTWQATEVGPPHQRYCDKDELTVELDREKLRREAVEARRMAEAAGNDVDRQFWLRIADGWSKLFTDAVTK
jgi:hypothetical protein